MDGNCVVGIVAEFTTGLIWASQQQSNMIACIVPEKDFAIFANMRLNFCLEEFIKNDEALLFEIYFRFIIIKCKTFISLCLYYMHAYTDTYIFMHISVFLYNILFVFFVCTFWCKNWNLEMLLYVHTYMYKCNIYLYSLLLL